ncbi:MAG: hypothetical protein U0802_20045 [Candidatus Binatia bacterium]
MRLRLVSSPTSPSPCRRRSSSRPRRRYLPPRRHIVHDPLSGPASNQRFRAAVLGDCTGNWQPGAALRAASPATVTAAAPRRVRGELRLPIRVEGAGFSAIELALRADPSLTLRSVQISPADAVVRAHNDADGAVTIAAASPRPLDRARLVAIFAGPGTARLIDSRVDELP